MQSLIRDDLIPRAVLGLKSLGVSTCDTEDFLDIILHRLNNKQNGCMWQQQFMAATHSQSDENFKLMTEEYLKNQQSGVPVSQWSS